MNIKKIPYQTSLQKQTEIIFGNEILLEEFILDLFKNCRCNIAIIADKNVEELYAKPFLKRLLDGGILAELLIIPAGENSKSRATIEKLEDELLYKGFGRDTAIIAIGGGVISDIAGFLASTFCRGVPFYIIPTTLMAMVDAAIGGKNGINTNYGKNLIGTFYQPKAIIVDIATLNTLPDMEFLNGVVEMIKHAIVLDGNYYDFLQQVSISDIKDDKELLLKAIMESCRIKLSVASEDPQEESKRVLLNFGHTVGHAIEKLSAFQISHGQAVAVGIMAESRLACNLGHLPEACYYKICELLHKYQIETKLSIPLAGEKLLEAMRYDKKALNKVPRFVMLTGIGSYLTHENSYCSEVEEKALLNILDALSPK